MRFSPKQRRVLNWWRKSSPDSRYDTLICDGAVRSGKTLCIGLSFVLWATATFSGQRFALCGKSAGAVRRNVWEPLKGYLKEMGLRWKERRSEGNVTISLGRRENTFYFFGGGDERSGGYVQGLTLAGLLLDEAALMPRSFVEQACARCSVNGARIWMSCNPEGPEHWLYKEWICRAEEKNALHLHFTMEDNPGLSKAVRTRYERAFRGAFYRRFVLGEWVAPEGRVYDFFTEETARDAPKGEMEEWCISCDYGTVNPASFGLWGKREGIWYRVKEFYFNSREEGRQMTDGEYAGKLRELAGGRTIRWVIVDPSAASFIELLHREGWRVKKAENDVLSGIRLTAEYLKSGRMVITPECRAAIREFSLYRWDTKSRKGDRVIKENDHAMDEIRYFAATVVKRERGGGETGGFFAAAVER